MNVPAVASSPHGFKMFDPSAGFQTGNDAVFLADSFRWDDQRDVFTHRFFGSETENSFRAGIPALDDAVQRFADDRVIRRFDDRGQQPGREQLAGFVALDLALRGNVAKDQNA